MTQAQNTVSVRGLGLSYGPRKVLDDITFDVGRDELVCIVGPSGVGKTSMLRCLAGLQTPTHGAVTFTGAEHEAGHIGLVFQDYAQSLLPWTTLLENVALPLRGKVSRAERHRRASAALAQVGLGGQDQLKPWQLSGGMQQRVAIARAMVGEPDVLLMDEPFASVDAQTRADLEDLTLKVRAETGKSVILITHDIDEAVYLADRVIVLLGRPAKGVPAHLAHDIRVKLGRDRNQISTRSAPEFVRLRTEVHKIIMDQSVPMVGA